MSDIKEMPVLLRSEMAHFLLGVLSLLAILSAAIIGLSIALLFASVSPPLHSFFKIDIQIFQKIIDPLFLCFLVSILCRIFFHFILKTQSLMPKVILFLSLLLGVTGIAMCSVLFAYGIMHFRHEFYGVTDPFFIFHALSNILG